MQARQFPRAVLFVTAVLVASVPVLGQWNQPGSIAPVGKSRIGVAGLRTGFPKAFSTQSRFQAQRAARAAGVSPGYGHSWAHSQFHRANQTKVSSSDGDISFKARVGSPFLGKNETLGHLPEHLHDRLLLNKQFVPHVPHFFHPFHSGFGHSPYYSTQRVPYIVDAYVYPSYAPTVIQLPQQAPPPPPEPTAFERGQILFEAGVYDRAVDELREAVKEEPDDFTRQRLLGAALIGDGRMREGVAVLAYAYGQNPSLAQVPLRRAEFGSGAHAVRGFVREAVAHASRAQTGEAWLVVAVLMQAEGRDQVAQRMARRALQEGLDTEVYDSLNRVLTQ